jgi:predicted MFS family arabinose efflux permease
MQSRWGVLGLVLVARTAMAFQFQSVAAVGPLLVADLGLSYAQLGTLIGFYLLPGAILAMPGGLLGARFGDRAVVLSALGLMTLGGAAMAVGSSWPVVAGGRLVSGAGGVLLNMLLAKIVTDWFAGRELATALGCMLTPWPVGIALSLIVLGALGAATSWRTAMVASLLFVALAFVLMLLLYRERAPGTLDGSGTGRRWWVITRREVVLVVVGCAAWATMNAGLILLLSFGPKLLVERGFDPARANLVVSWASFLSVTAVLGGVLLDRVRWRDAVIATGLTGAAAATGAFALGGPVALWSALVGIFVAPAPGVVALPGEVLSPASRSTGFGLFYALFYAGMAVAPVTAGYLVDRGGGVAALWLAVAMWLAALPALALFRALQRRWISPRPA